MAVGYFHYRQVLGPVALASSEQTVFEVTVRVSLVDRAQMADTDEIQVAPGYVFLVRPLPFKRRGEWLYELRQSPRSQKQGRGSVAPKAGWHGSAAQTAGWHGRHGP